MRAGRQQISPGQGQIIVETETVRIGGERFGQLKDVDHLDIGMAGSHLHERRIVYQVNRVGERHGLRAGQLRVRRDSEIGQCKQDNVLDPGLGQRVDRVLSASDDARHKGLNALGSLGQVEEKKAS